MAKVRTRFAPSPTGYLHVGGVRTALFAWLTARQSNGEFILRLEDTDKSREVEGSAEHLIECLNALGLDYDEGPDQTGDLGPYRQSERLDIYKKWAEKLIEQGRAYVDPYTPEEVQAFREQAQKEKKAFLFRNFRPSLEPIENNQLKADDWYGKRPLRFKSDPDFYANWNHKKPITDEVLGELNIDPQTTDDFVLIKSDGYPTYNFAHIIDDHEMKITHVIRGQEFISSMPGYLDLYSALGFDLPKFAHLPHILNEQGNKKLSKRDGAKDILDYIRQGYLPEALRSFIATLGWNDGTEQEIFTTEELIDKFSLSRVGKSGAHFDERRLNWVNGHFIRNMELEDLYDKVHKYWPKEALDFDDVYRKKVLSVVQERMKYFEELPELTIFFFKDMPVDDSLIKNHKQLKKLESEDTITLLEAVKSDLSQSDFTVEDLTNRLNGLLTITHTKPALLFSLIRIAITQSPASPGLAETLSILGKDTSLDRIDAQIKQLVG